MHKRSWEDSLKKAVSKLSAASDPRGAPGQLCLAAYGHALSACIDKADSATCLSIKARQQEHTLQQ